MRHFIIFLLITGFLVGIQAQTPDFTGLKVMVNPGHGGHDSDDRGMPNGFWESEGNLTKGLWLRDLLEARGCEVIMSRVLNRTEDDLPLSQIAAMANQNNVDLFTSIHSNAFNQYTNYPLTIFNGKSESPTNPQAKVWAIHLWEQLITNQATHWTNTSPHYIGDLTLNPNWNYGYGVLYPLVVPGIISEGSFHDYQPEMDRLLNLDYRKQEAWNILYAMITYFGLEGTETIGHISGIIRDSLLMKDNYTLPGPDGYHNVNGAKVELLETGEIYQVDTLNTGFYMFDSIAPGNYHLVFSAQNYFNDTVPVEVLAHQFSYVNFWMEADKTMPPNVIRFSPTQDGVTPCFDPVTITFSMNMDSASVAEAFSIDPPMEGVFTWDDKYLNVTFQPIIPYDTATVYTVVLDSTAKHQWDVSMDTVLTFSFTTDNRNRYILESSFPSAGQVEVSPYLQFRLVFEAPVNNTSLINAVSIVAEDGTVLSTKAATIFDEEGKGHYYFSPETDLSYQTTYSLVLSGTIQDHNGIPIVDTLKIGFTTKEDPGEITILNEFDDAGAWSIDMSNSQGLDPASFVYRWRKTKRSGDASMLVRYFFTSEDAFCMIKPDTPINLHESLPDAGMWIWGELSNLEVVLGFNDGSEASLGQLDFAGWNYLVSEIPDGAVSLTHIKFIRAAGGPENGDIYVDALHQPGSTVSVDPGRATQVKIYPNPVSGNTLYIQGLPEEEWHYTISSVAGSVIQEGVLEPDQVSLKLNEDSQKQQLFILYLQSNLNNYSILVTTK